MGRSHKCPYCGLLDTVAKGYRRTKQMGKRRIRLCKSCRRKFTPKNQKPVEEVGLVSASTESSEPLQEPPDHEWTS